MAFNRLNYGERSVRIFTTSSEQTFNRGFDRGRPNFEGRENREGPDRMDFRNMPDSIRQRIFAETERNIAPDSLRQGREGAFTDNRDNFRDRNVDRDRHGRGDFRRGRNVQLSNVSRFLAVFVLFTVLTICLDKGNSMIRRKKKTTLQNKC
jgi:hypothetical protein